MKIRKAKQTDKKLILAFCQNTFSWGDYIDRVWDYWQSKGNLLTVEENKKPVGICNISFSKNQIWIEGVRINQNFRRKGFATRLILKAEELGRQKKKKISRMLIAQENKRSLLLAKSLGYKIEDKWWLYNLRPKRRAANVNLAKNTKKLEFLIGSDTYSESWEWLALDKDILGKLIKKKRVLVASNRKIAIGIWNISQIDKDVLQLGYVNGTKSGIDEILRFMQNKGHFLKSKRIQVLVQQKTKLTGADLDKRMLFCLVKKELS